MTANSNFNSEVALDICDDIIWARGHECGNDDEARAAIRKTFASATDEQIDAAIAQWHKEMNEVEKDSSFRGHETDDAAC